MHLSIFKLWMFEIVLESVAFASCSHRGSYTDVRTALVCNLSLKLFERSISDCKDEVLCSDEISQSYHQGEWNNRTANTNQRNIGKKITNYCIFSVFYRFLGRHKKC